MNNLRTYRHHAAHAVTAIFLGLCAAATAPALAKTPALNPAQLGPFCPVGSELADAKHTQILSLQEQEQIKKTVQGFMALDAEYRRTGSPRGALDYWKKGYTAQFKEFKDVPDDGLLYIANRFSNICIQSNIALSIVLLDVVDFGQSVDPPTQESRFHSSQYYWDAFQKTPFRPPSNAASVTPDQPLVFVGLPLSKDTNGRWLVEQRKVPTMVMFSKRDWKERIDSDNLFGGCSRPRNDPRYKDYLCIEMEKTKAELKRFSRPAWSVVPQDFTADPSVRK